MSNTFPSQPRAAFRALPSGVPPDALAHLGITGAQILALEVLGISLVDAANKGIITLPSPLTPEAFPGYLRSIAEWVAMGLDPNEPHDVGGMVTLEQAKTSGLLPDFDDP